MLALKKSIATGLSLWPAVGRSSVNVTVVITSARKLGQSKESFVSLFYLFKMEKIMGMQNNIFAHDDIRFNDILISVKT